MARERRALRSDIGVARSARFERGKLIVSLTNGKEVSASLGRFPRLADATPAQRSRYEIEGDGMFLHWEEIDEDIGVAQLLGVPEVELERLLGDTVYE